MKQQTHTRFSGSASRLRHGSAHDPHRENEKCTTNAPKTALIGFGLFLGIVLALVETTLGWLGEQFSSPWWWLVGTPVCFLLFPTLCALLFAEPRETSQQKLRAYAAGLLTGVFGAILGSSILITWTLTTSLSGSLVRAAVLFVFIPLVVILNFSSCLILGLVGGVLGKRIGGALRSARCNIEHRDDLE